MQQSVERMYSFTEICSIFNISRNLAGNLFRGRPGVLNMATGVGRPAFRVPTSTLVEVMIERGYTRERALELLGQLPRGERHV